MIDLAWRKASTIWLPLTLYLLLAFCYFVTVPPLEGFDASAHMNAANYLRKEQRLPLFDRATGEFSYELIAQPPLYHALAALATGWLPYDSADQYVRDSANRYFPELSHRQSIDLPTVPQSVKWALLLARLVSLVGGLCTVAASWLWVHTLLPAERWLPTAVAATVGLNPLFLFISTSITNDAWAAAGTVGVIWLVTAMAARGETRLMRWLLVGMVAGLAVLIKYSVPLLAGPALLILLYYRHKWSLVDLGKIAAMLLIGAVLTAGFWYGRSLLLYGSIIPLETMSEALITLLRPTLMPLTEVWEILPFLFYSYWGLFVATFAPAPFLRLLYWLVMIALIGLPIALYKGRGTVVVPLIWLALTWFALNLISMVNYMRLISYGEQARFLLPAAPATGLLLVLGCQAWLPRRYAGTLRALILPLFVLIALWPLPTLHRAYAQPPAVVEDAPERAVKATFEGGMTVAGYSLPSGAAAAPDAVLPVTLYLSAEQPIAEDATLFLHLLDEQERLLYQYDGVPYAGRHPTRQWQAGQLFADTYELDLAAPVVTDTLATLTLGFYRFGEPTERLPVYDAHGAEIGDRVVLGEIRLLAAAPPGVSSAAEPLAQWANGVELLEATVTSRAADGYAVRLVWRTTAPLAVNYTVFAQFIGDDGRVAAQSDQMPGGDRVPTSTWLVNEEIVDTHFLAAAEAGETLIVGLYDARTGERVPLQAPPAQDYYAVPVPKQE